MDTLDAMDRLDEVDTVGRSAECYTRLLEETKAMLETNMARWEREWQERSEAHGREEGRAEGVAAERTALLVRLLERRFGQIDDSVRARIAAASPDELLAYADRVLDARDIDSVFSG